jgi:transposase
VYPAIRLVAASLVERTRTSEWDVACLRPTPTRRFSCPTGNARLTVHGRRLIVQRHQDGWKQAHIAAAMGVSRKCVKTWVDRYDAEGEPDLQDRSSRPHSTPTKTTSEVEEKVLAAGAEHRDGPDVLAPKVGVPARTVSRILRRHGVPHLRECDPMTGEVIRSSKATAVRYERDRAGELVHMDVKKIGRIPDGGGWRAHGREMCSTAQRKATPIGRLHPLTRRRPLAPGLQRGPLRREGHRLCGVPRTRHTSRPMASHGSSG